MPPARISMRADSRAGMTLLELVMVMALLGLFLGAGVGMLSSLDFGQRAALGTVQNLIRATRNSAVARSAPARVRFDAEAGVVSGEVFEVIGTWRFEGDLDGARGHRGNNEGAVFVEDGWIGQALSFAGQSGATAQFPVQVDPSWDFEHGFRIDCVVRVEGPSGGRAIDVGGLFGIEVLGRGALGAWFVPAQVDATGTPRAGGRQVLRAPEGTLVGGEWLRVRVEYDRRVARMYVEGVEVARIALALPMWRMEGPLVLGDSRRNLEVGLDGLVIGTFGGGDRVELPDTVRLIDAPVAIAFDSGGHLDREVHPGPVEFVLEFEDGRRTPLLVGPYGTIEAGVTE